MKEALWAWSNFGGDLDIEYDEAHDVYEASPADAAPFARRLVVDGRSVRHLYRLPRPRTVHDMEQEMAWADGYFHHELFLRSLSCAVDNGGVG